MKPQGSGGLTSQGLPVFDGGEKTRLCDLGWGAADLCEIGRYALEQRIGKSRIGQGTLEIDLGSGGRRS
jgi:hypothetical protein